MLLKAIRSGPPRQKVYAETVGRPPLRDKHNKSPKDPERPDEPMLVNADPNTPRPCSLRQTLAAPATGRLRNVRRAVAVKLLRVIFSEAFSQPRPGPGAHPHACPGRALHDPPAARPTLEAAARPAVPVSHDGVEAMLSILAALRDGGRSSLGELAAATGLGPERLAGHALNLKDDGCLIFEREETLRLTSSGRAALEELGRGRLHPSETPGERT